MKTSAQLYIDKNLVKPFAWILNILVRIVGKILRINHDLDKSFTRIAICKFKGMGSILQATPLISALREKYPNAEIIFISTRSNRQIIEKIPEIDRAIYLDDSSVLKLIRTSTSSLFKLWKSRPQLYFDLEIYSDFSSVFTTLSLSTNRIGFYLRSSSFRMGTYTHMMFFNPKIVISDVYLQMAALVGCKIEEKKFLRFQKKDTSPFDFNYLVINPNASDLRLERKWPEANFVALSQQLLEQFSDTHLVFIGAPSERAYTQKIIAQLKDSRVHNTAGDTNIDQVIEIIQHAQAVITNDTGPMHLTLMTNTPSVSLFGPCAPEQYGLNGKQHKILYKPVYCSPCVHEFEKAPCNGNNVCMQLITVHEVFTAVSGLLKGENVESPSQEKISFQYQQKTLGLVLR